jgi:hypothetical protein
MALHIRKYLLRGALPLLVLVNSLLGGTSSKNIVATRTQSPITIDGLLKEDAWRTAVPVSGFLQYDPDEGAPATEVSVVRVLYDDNAVYVGVMCYDSQATDIQAQLTRRDRIAQADRFTVVLDTYHDHSTGFLFSGAVSGVQSDGILSQDGTVYDVQWDAVWDFNAKILPDGWSAEFRIPYSALRFSAQDSEYIWGVNFRRYMARKKETTEWVMVPRKDVLPGTVSSVSRMGHLSGIRDIHPPLHLELLPYALSKATFLTQPEPFPLKKKVDGALGLDLKYGVTHNFTFDMAVNPDFGQVEVDQAVLNLSVFETFYPEKRPFFLEGSPIFTFGNGFDNQQMRLFYSRRVGKRSTTPLDTLRTGYTLVESPEAAPILFAGKLTGRTDNGLTAGVLTAVTDREYGVSENLNGDRNDMLFAPRESFNVIRLRQDVLENSSVGVMATSGFNDRISPALSGGIDWNLRFADATYAVDGYLTRSSLGNGVSGSAGRIGLGKLAGLHWRAFSAYDFSTRDYHIDELGYYSQPREHGGYVQVSYKEDKGVPPVRRWVMTLQSEYRWNWDAVNTVKNLELEPSWEFMNFWLLDLDYIHELPAFDDANRGIYGLYRRPSGNQFTATLQTDTRQQFSLWLRAVHHGSDIGQKQWIAAVQLSVRPNSWMEFAPSITLFRTRSEESWVQSVQTGWPILTDDGRNLFGDRDVDEYDFSMRGTVTFTRSVSLQFYTQVFLAKGGYSNFRKLAAPDLLLPVDYTISPSYENPDFNQKVFNANLVFRWEYLPGSTLYLVWTQARSGNEGPYSRPLTENFSDTFRLPMDNVLLAKISYWWSL